MPLISFSVFKEKVLDGTKSQTIRPLRKHPIKKYDSLYLYWKCRTKETQLLRTEVCSEEFLIKMSIFNNGYTVYMHIWPVGSVKELSSTDYEKLARKDGFSGFKEMVEWFYNRYGELREETYQVIRWNPIASLCVEKTDGVH